MSHYAVAVFSDDQNFDSLLAKFNECDKNYFVFTEVPYEKIEEEYKEFVKKNVQYSLRMFIENEYYEQHNGKWGYWSNPNAKYDYYSIDGMDYLFDPKPGVEISNEDYYYHKNDLDYKLNDKYREIPYAFVTPDGEWHSPGKVLWFGISTDTEEQWNEYEKEWDAYIMSDANPFVTIADFHI